MSDTPETDAEAITPSGFEDDDVSAEFARKLERERDEAREKIKRQTDRIRYLEGATNYAKGTPLSIALKERDEAREHLEHVKEYGTEEINASVDLRQKLAQALVELDNMQDQRDLAMKVISRLERERDEARDELSKILKNE